MNNVSLDLKLQVASDAKRRMQKGVWNFFNSQAEKEII